MGNLDEDGEYYLVEKILESKTTKNGEKEYRIKWRYLNEVENTWVKASDCFCHSMIEEFENKKKRKSTEEPVTPVKDKKPAGKRSKGSEEESPQPAETEKNGENWDLLVAEVTTVFRIKNVLMMKLKWKEDGSIVTIPAEEANKKCPARVIEFYEKHLKFVG